MNFEDGPVMVSYGGGVDSTAILVEMVRRSIRPDLVIFADTGGEKPETYRFIDSFSQWLEARGFPTVERVTRNDVVNVRPTTPYRTLEGELEHNETMPSIAFGRKSCSIKWKAEPIDRWVKRWAPAIDAWAQGARVTRIIGYDAGPADSRRAVNFTGDDRYVNRYLLREWGWDRERCIDEIRAAGLEPPPKSACFFCPASKPHEIEALRSDHPELYDRAIQIEDRWKCGRHGGKGSTVGLGRRFSWAELTVGGCS